MKDIQRLIVLLMCGYVAIGQAVAEKTSSVPDVSTVPANLKFTQDISTRFHVVAWVTLQPPDGSTEKFQYDRYPSHGLRPGVERVKRSEGVFARPAGKEWVRSDNWGVTGKAVNEKMRAILETDVNVVAVMFQSPENRDSAQGNNVWRYVGSKAHGTATDYTFELTREHPKEDGRYPQYTFLKARGDTDGRLFLCGVSANLRDDAGLISMDVSMTYLIPVAAGTKVQVYDKDTGKEKLNTVTGADSGWEITTPTSEPPTAH